MSHHKLIILVILVALGLLLQLSGVIDSQSLISMARGYAEHWWLGVILVAIQTVLFTFALAGSTMVWIVAALFNPLVSTLLITTGTSLGGILAYLFSERLSDEWVHKVQHSRIYQLLRKEGNVFTLLALRMMPGFPHSVINYSSGILKISFTSFIPATIAGTAIKTYVYSSVIYNATTPGALSGTIELSSVWPLLALSLLILVGIAVKNHLGNK